MISSRSSSFLAYPAYIKAFYNSKRDIAPDESSSIAEKVSLISLSSLLFNKAPTKSKISLWKALGFLKSASLVSTVLLIYSLGADLIQECANAYSGVILSLALGYIRPYMKFFASSETVLHSGLWNS